MNYGEASDTLGQRSPLNFGPTQEECNSRPVMCEMCGQIVAMDKLEIHMVEDAKSHILPLLKENQSLRRRVDELEKLIQVRPQEFQ